MSRGAGQRLTAARIFPTIALVRGVLAAALLLTAARADATRFALGEGYRTGKFDLGLSPGWAIPVGTAGDYLKTSFVLNVTGAYQFDDYASAGLEVGWQFKHSVTGNTKYPELARDYNNDGFVDHVPFGSNMRDTILHLTPFLKVGPWLEAFGYRWRPFMLAGAGLYEESVSSGRIVVSGNDERSGNGIGPVNIDRDSSVNAFFGFNVGPGFEVQIEDNAAIGFDLRYSRVFRPIAAFDFIEPSIRILYLF